MAWMRQENCTLKILCHQEGGINGRISAKIISASFPHVLLNSDTLSYKIIPAAGRLQGPSLCSWQKTTITVHGQCPAQHVPRPRTPTREASLQHFSCFLKLFLSTRCKALPDSLRGQTDLLAVTAVWGPAPWARPHSSFMLFLCPSSFWLEFLFPQPPLALVLTLALAQLLEHSMTGMAKIKEGKGVLSPTVIPCRKNAPLSFFSMGTRFTLKF